MDKETIEKKLKYEIEFLKIYAVFVIAISTGVASLVIRGNIETSRWEGVLFILGSVFLLIFVTAFILSLFRAIKFFKKL